MGADGLMHVTSVSVGGELLGDVRLFHFTPNFQLAEVTEADEARYHDSDMDPVPGAIQAIFPRWSHVDHRI